MRLSHPDTAQSIPHHCLAPPVAAAHRVRIRRHHHRPRLALMTAGSLLSLQEMRPLPPTNLEDQCASHEDGHLGNESLKQCLNAMSERARVRT